MWTKLPARAGRPHVGGAQLRFQRSYGTPRFLGAASGAFRVGFQALHPRDLFLLECPAVGFCTLQGGLILIEFPASRGVLGNQPLQRPPLAEEPGDFTVCLGEITFNLRGFLGRSAGKGDSLVILSGD